MRASAILGAVAFAGAVACDALDAPAPVPTSVEPSRGWAGDRTPIVVHGSGFVVRAAQPASGGAVAVDDAHRAWLGEIELEDVARVDAGTLRATVPAGLPAGRHALVVENPFGARGRLGEAFEVVATAGAALSVTIAADATSLTVGQGFAVRATVANPGTAPASGVRAVLVATSADGGAAALSGPTPPSVASLPAGEEVELSWSGVAIAVGEISLALSVTATDDLSGQALESAAPVQHVAILLPAGLVGTIAASRAAVSAGQAVEATFTLTNGGAAAAEVTGVTPSWEPVPGTTCTPPAPPSPVEVPSGGAVAFRWSCTPAAPGELRLSATAEGEDANSGAPLAATPAIPASVLVEAPAALSAAIGLPSGTGTASVGQPLTLALVVSNVGEAGAEVIEVTPTVTPPGAAACGAPAPGLPRDVPGGESLELVWTCTPAVPGAVTFGASVAGRDANSGAALHAAPVGAAVTVQLPAALAAVVQASRSVANVGQPVGVTFTVTNGGTAAAVVSAVTPSSDGTAPATCGAPAPAPPLSIPSGAALAFSWTCTATGPGALSLSGRADGEDANSGAPLAATPAAPATVEIQAPAALSAAIALPPEATTVSVGQPIPLMLTVTNSGGAEADVLAIGPTIAPAGAAACGPASPPPPRGVAGGATAEFRWSCTPASPGAVTFGATVEGRDRNTLGPLAASTSPGATATVEPPAALSAVVSAAPLAVNTGQAVTVTFTVTNGEGAVANLLAVEPAVSGIPGASCGDPAPPLPPSLGPGEALVLGWTCVAGQAGTLQLSGSVTGSDANSGAPIAATPAAPASVAVQTPAALSAAISLPGTVTAIVGRPLEVALTVANAGGAGADVTAVEPEVEPAGAASCGAPSPAPPQLVAGGGSVELRWACTPAAEGQVSFGAAISGRDRNTGEPVALEPEPPATVTVERPASLAATAAASRAVVDVGQSVAVTLTVANGGGATAVVTSIAHLVGGTATADCGPPAEALPQAIAAGGAFAFTWTCTPTAPGELTLSGMASGHEQGSGAPLAATPAEPAAALVQVPAALSAALSLAPGSDPVPVGGPLGVTLVLSNAGDADAEVTAVALTVLEGAAECGPPAPAPPFVLGGGASVEIAWTCAPAAPGALALAASAAGRDVNTLAPLEVAADPVATTVVPLPPADLAYSPNPAVYVVGTAIEPNVPAHSGGAVDGWSVDPPLPAGLALDPATGAISGTPLVAADAAVYRVTATNAAGSTDVALEIAVLDVPP